MSRRAEIRIEALHVADFVHPPETPLAGQSGIVMAYVVIHTDGVLLFDSGIGIGDAGIDAAYRPTVHDLPNVLRAGGIEPDDIDALANSHLHFDHCGQNAALPGRPIHVQAAEYEAATAGDYTIPGWVDFPGAQYVQHAGDVELFPGIRLVPTPGHTPGHQSLLVDAADGRTAIVGQAVLSRAEWEGADDPSVSGLASAWDSERYRSSVRRLRAFKPDTVLFGHER